MAVLTPSGLVIRRYPEILQLIQDSLRERVSSELLFDEDTFLGQTTQIFAAEFAALEEVLQMLEDAKDRDKAEGNSLDSLLFLVGLKRLPSTRSAGEVYIICRENTSVPAGTMFVNSSSGDKFYTRYSAMASQSACRTVWYEIEAKNNANYNISVNENAVVYTTTNNDESQISIINNLVSRINNIPFVSEIFEASQELVNGKYVLAVRSKVEGVNINCSVLQNMKVERISIAMLSDAALEGAIIVPKGAIDAIGTGVGGIFHIWNELPFGVGRNRETDAAFKARANRELAMAGSSTYTALFTALRNIPEASGLTIIENATNIIMEVGDSELPPHSFEVVIDIPNTPENDEIVARKIWEEKPIGIQTVGDVSKSFLDSNDQIRTIKFSRPQTKFIAIRVLYSTYNEEQITESLVDTIKDQVMAYGQTLTTDKDVIPRRFIGSIYDNTSGLDNVIVQAQMLSNSGETPNPNNWTENRLEISAKQTAGFLRSNIFVEYDLGE